MERKTLDAIPTSAGPMTPRGIVNSLTHSSYAYNRDLGMSAKGARLVFGAEAEAMEREYQLERDNETSEQIPF